MQGRIDIAGVKRMLARFPSALDTELRKGLKEHGLFFTQRMKREQFTGYSGFSNSGSRLQARTGKLRNSFGSEVRGEIGTSIPLTLAVFSQGAIYSRLQEYGGTVKPKRAKYLTQPLPDNQTTAGVTRYGSARELFERYPDQVRVMKARSGRLFIVSEGKPGAKTKKKNPDLLWLFILRKSVKVPPRLGFRATWSDSTSAADRVQRLNDAVKRAAAKVGG